MISVHGTSSGIASSVEPRCKQGDALQDESHHWSLPRLVSKYSGMYTWNNKKSVQVRTALHANS